VRRRLIAPHRYQGEILFVVRIAAVDRLYGCCQSQLANALADLAANKRIPILFFMLNQPTGLGDPAEAVGRERIMLGFPGVGGMRDGHIRKLGDDRAAADNGR